MEVSKSLAKESVLSQKDKLETQKDKTEETDKAVTSTGFISPTHSLSVMESMSMKDELVHEMHHLDFQH